MMIRKVFNKKKGSSSIMVILIMLTLVVFGVLALMSSYSDLKLSKKNANWLEKYYDLDAKGEKLISEIDSRLSQASKKAKSGNTLDREKYIQLAESEIKAIKTENKLKVSKNKNMLTISSKLVDVDNNMINISLEVNFPDFSMEKGPLKHYKVTRWEQLPREFKYDNSIELWDGEVK